MFNNFCDYMYSLLFTPMKKVRQSVNQFYILFKVLGKLFDETKQDILRVREESMIISASETILPEHGRDRNMIRLKDETVEGYRRRLCMKAVLAEKAGTLDCLVLCLKSLELEGQIIPYYTIDKERWAEFIVQINYDLNNITRMMDMGTVRSQIRLLKPASAKDNYLLSFFTDAKLAVTYRDMIQVQIEFYPQLNLPPHDLEGLHELDGSKPLNGYATDKTIDLYPVQLVVNNDCQVTDSITAGVTVEDHLRYLDGNGTLDGNGCLNADIYHYEL